MNTTDEKGNGTDELFQLVSFKIGPEEFGIDILKVQEINRMMQITKIPNAPEYVDGAVNLRGKIIPVVNLRTRLKLPRKDNDKATRIIVVELSAGTIGFVVDEVSEVLRIPISIMEEPPRIVSGIDSDFITSIGKLEDRLLILLDLERIISKGEKIKTEEFETV